MTGTKFLIALLAAILVVGCGPAAEPEATQDPKKPDQSQVDAVKAEGGIK